MKQTRRLNIFETNSSSTHALTIKDYEDTHYLSPSNKLIVDFINTDDERVLTTLRAKVSYLVSLIINRYKYDCIDYADLKEQVEHSYDFIKIKDKVKEKFGKEVVLPEKYVTYDEDDNPISDNLNDIVNINHQLYSDSLQESLEDMTNYGRDLLDEALSSNTKIVFGSD